MRSELEQAVELLRQNHAQSLEQALTLLQNTVFSFSMKVCGHREDAEDTMQETLLKAASFLRRFDDPKALAVWLYKVAKNRCLMSRRRSKFAPAQRLSLEELMPDRETLHPGLDPDRSTPESALLQRETHQRVQQAVSELPPHYRLILVLHDMEGLSTEEITRVTGLQEGTVRVRLHRARVFVRNKLAAAGVHMRSARRTSAKAPRRCRELFAILSDHLDGVLDPKRCDELEKHVAECPPCEAFLRSLEHTVNQLRRYPSPRLDPQTAARARRALLGAYQRALRAVPRAERS